MLLWSSDTQISNRPDPAVVQTSQLLKNKFSVAEVFLHGEFPQPLPGAKASAQRVPDEQFEPGSLF